jgi:hypothetical protein
MTQRPVSVTIFGILNIGLAIFGAASAVLSKIIMTVIKLPSNGLAASLHNNPTYVAWSNVSMMMSILGGCVMLVAGIGLLLLKNWGRILSIGYAIYAIIWALIGAGMTFHLAGNGIRQSFPQVGQLGVFFAVISVTVVLVFTLTYPILLLIFMVRPNVVAACQGVVAGGPPVVAPPPNMG